MKTKLFVAVLVIAFFASCMQKQELTQQEKDQIKKELASFTDNFKKVYESGDMEAAMKYYWDSNEFIAVGADAVIKDYPAFKKENEEQFKTVSLVKITTAKEEYRVINKEAVIVMWQGQFEVTLKDGSGLVFNPDAVSWVMQKINNEWKITYEAGSGLPPVFMAAKNK